MWKKQYQKFKSMQKLYSMDIEACCLTFVTVWHVVDKLWQYLSTSMLNNMGQHYEFICICTIQIPYEPIKVFLRTDTAFQYVTSLWDENISVIITTSNNTFWHWRTFPNLQISIFLYHIILECHSNLKTGYCNLW